MASTNHSGSNPLSILVKGLAPAYALMTGWAATDLLRSHAWGSEGRPGWANHPGRVGLLAGLTLLAIWLAAIWWNSRWMRNVITMAKARYEAWYRWSLAAGIVVGTGVGFLLVLFEPTRRIPTGLLFLFILGLTAIAFVPSVSNSMDLETLAREQRSLLLQSQLAPHFLFNSLSTLKGQIASDPQEAQSTADRLARLFQELMDMGSAASVPLSRELAFVEAYLGLEQARLGDRLKVRIEVPEELETLAVPALGLQVLVENAVRHAIASRVEGGTLTVRASRQDGVLRLSVTDPGDGTSPRAGTGRGLAALRARLERPEDLTFRVTPEGHVATLSLRT
jgi:signal transduction histidine kinase